MASVANKPKETVNSVSAELKRVRKSIHDEQKECRKKETMYANKVIKYKRNPNYAEYMKVRNEAIKRAHRRNATDDELKLCGIDGIRLSSGPEIDHVSEALMEVHKGNLKYRDIDIFFNDTLTELQQKTILKALLNTFGDRNKIDEIGRIAKPQYTPEEMKMAISKIMKGCSQNEIDAVFLMSVLKETSCFDREQKEAIKFGFDGGLDKHQLERIAMPELDSNQMREIVRGYKKGLSEKKIALYASPRFSSKQMEMIRHALDHNVPYDEVKKFAKPSIPVDEMCKKSLAAVDYYDKHPLTGGIKNLEKAKKNKQISSHTGNNKSDIGLEGT